MNYPFPFQEEPEKIEQIIGQKITYFSTLVKDEKPYSIPLITWIKTENGIWHRFLLILGYFIGQNSLKENIKNTLKKILRME